MFEKSLYDLIRGLRNHKGNEAEYIQHSLRECRTEIKGSDMDLKATALLKLVYLEMFGFDMSWASFHVLEVMSSPKYPQKRVGYLGAVQSFRRDTEVLMLATNSLKKDITSPWIPVLSLPFVLLPHVSDAALAMSLSPDILSRLSHPSADVRKKTIAALYRLGLVYPDCLKAAWPRLQSLLMDEEQDSSVSSTIVNVICELGRRQPRDFLALAPRLFELLVDQGNNWMAIKIVKLFAILIPIEPRLQKKLQGPLIQLIETTPAMSLLYECINGAIQGGLIDDASYLEDDRGLPQLCVSKLRSMILIDGDPNLKYVALLAYSRIAMSHPLLVASQEDVILECLSDADISIRLKAMDLAVGMANSKNLVTIVHRLLRQLQAGLPASTDARERPGMAKAMTEQDSGENMADDGYNGGKLDQSDSREFLNPRYRIQVISRILQMCSNNMYARVEDFRWYISILVRLIHLAPNCDEQKALNEATSGPVSSGEKNADIVDTIGWQLRDIATRVHAARPEILDVAVDLIADPRRYTASSSVKTGLLGYAAWIIGEFASEVSAAGRSLDHLLSVECKTLPNATIAAYLQAIPKVVKELFTQSSQASTLEWTTKASLALKRILDFTAMFITHSDLEVQERASQLREFVLVLTDLSKGHNPSIERQDDVIDVLVGAYPTSALNPMARTAQHKVPVPPRLDLECSLNVNLSSLLQDAQISASDAAATIGFRDLYLYSEAPLQTASSSLQLDMDTLGPRTSNSNTRGSSPDETVSRIRVDARQKMQNDPFYIGSSDFRAQNRESLPDVDLQAIPIMDLDLSGIQELNTTKPSRAKTHKRFEVVPDETIEAMDTRSSDRASGPPAAGQGLAKRHVLQVDSRRFDKLSLRETEGQAAVSQAFTEDEDREMARALAEVERARLEMQRASERVRYNDEASAEGVLVKKRKKKVRKKVTQKTPEPEA